MIYHLAENGTMAIVLPHGVLFRGAAELHIRKYLIEQKKLFGCSHRFYLPIFSTEQVYQLVFWYLKSVRKILIISYLLMPAKEFEKVKNQNMLREEHIDKIVETYRNKNDY